MLNVIQNNARQALIAALFIVSLLCSLYFIVEPQVSRAVAAPDFSIRQDVGAEISFLVNAANVTMTGQLSGLTGGNATGTTQAVVLTNSATGYSMTLAFADGDGDGNMMRRDLGGASTGSIKNYSTSTRYNNMVEPSYNFSFASTATMFAYTVTASDTNDIDQSFLNNGTICNAGSGTGVNLCWMAPTTTPFEITHRSSSASGGSTTTIRFRVYMPNSPNPNVDTGFYTATATLSAITI